MKWIGQHIWNFISRFRTTVYFENLETSSETNVLVVDSDGKVTKNSSASGDITAVTITTDSGGGSAATDSAGSADFSILGSSGVDVTNSGTTITATAVPGEIDHDALSNFVANEHIDWTTDQGGTNIHTDNIEDLHGAGVNGNANQLLTDDGDGSITSEATLTYHNETLTLGENDNGEAYITRRTHTDGNGGDLVIQAGSATNGQTNMNAGSLVFKSGQPTGSGTFGSFQFYSGDTDTGGTAIRTTSELASLGPNGATSTDFTLYEKGGATIDDFFQISVAASASTTIRTNDDYAAAGDLMLDIDGDITLDAAARNIFYSHNGTPFFEMDMGGPIFKSYGGSNTVDYFGIETGTNGVTTIGTVDSDSNLANLTINADGDLNLTSTTNKINKTYDFHGTLFETTYDDDEGSGTILKYSPDSDQTLSGSTLYFLHTDGVWTIADADFVSKGASQLLGVGLGASARTTGVLIKGFVRIAYAEILNIPGSGAVDGLPVYVSTTAGHFDFNAPVGVGDYVRIVGYAIDGHDEDGDSDEGILIYFDPDKTWIERA